jgi:hypothetical protein
MNDLLRGRVSRFSLDALVNIAAAIGRRVHVELESIRPHRVLRPLIRTIDPRITVIVYSWLHSPSRPTAEMHATH